MSWVTSLEAYRDPSPTQISFLSVILRSKTSLWPTFQRKHRQRAHHKEILLLSLQEGCKLRQRKDLSAHKYPRSLKSPQTLKQQGFSFPFYSQAIWCAFFLDLHSSPRTANGWGRRTPCEEHTRTTLERRSFHICLSQYQLSIPHLLQSVLSNFSKSYLTPDYPEKLSGSRLIERRMEEAGAKHCSYESGC